MSVISRVTRSKEEAKASYDKLSKWYDLLTGESEKKYQDIGLRMLNVQPGETALEIGFGTGQALLSLARSVGEAGKVYGLDISEGMLNATRIRARKAGRADRIELSCGDAVSMSYPNGSFDAVFLCFTLELFDTPEIPLVLRECQRVLRQEGRVCVVAMSKKGKANLMTKLYHWGHQKIPNYIDCRPIYAQEALEEAGFVVAELKVMSMWGLPVEIVLATN
jgi:demethylmenaquinone methyltransferase/2-methoxy-6-polyprenyl-1,4-benzoquinol methylase